jgi:hypothetical protein
MKQLFFILILVVATAPANAQKVRVGVDPSVDLSKYKTYAWSKGLAVQNPIVHQYVLDAVDRAMTAKGFTRVEVDPEITVVIFTMTESDLHVTTASPGFNSMQNGIVLGSQAWPVTKGTLVVDLFDARTKNSVWRATASHTLDHGPTGNPAKDAKSVEKPIRKAVEKMFKQFPHPNQT